MAPPVFVCNCNTDKQGSADQQAKGGQPTAAHVLLFDLQQHGPTVLRIKAVQALALSALFSVPAHASDSASDQPNPEALACLAEAVYFEARGTTDKGAVAVAHVVVNRRDSAKFPSTICGVVNDGCQFSYQCDGAPEALTDADERDRAYKAAETVLAGDAPDPTDGALFFHSSGVTPGWFSSRPRVGEIAGNIFYR